MPRKEQVERSRLINKLSLRIVQLEAIANQMLRHIKKGENIAWRSNMPTMIDSWEKELKEKKR